MYNYLQVALYRTHVILVFTYAFFLFFPLAAALLRRVANKSAQPSIISISYSHAMK